MTISRLFHLLICEHLCHLWLISSLLAAEPFAIEVVDDRTGRGVPLVELRTVHDVRLVTDSGGLAAFDEPGLMGRKVFFHVKAHGYEFPKDGFGYRGRALDVRPGGSARLEIRRINIAERLYRVTGAGIYRDTVLAGRKPPIKQPLLNAQVLGSDSVVNAIYRGKLRWFWGDTNRPGYPLGLFHVPGATSARPADGGLDPEIGVDLDYFTGPDGFARAMAKLPGEGPTWIFGLFAFKESSGRERMFAMYSKVRPPLDIYERGLAEYDDEHDRFEKVAAFPADAPSYPGGQAFLRREDAGAPFVYFATPYPLLRVRAIPDDLARLDRYEAFTCLAPGSKLADARIERDAEGRPAYAWRRDTPAVGPEEQARLIRAGALRPDEVLLPLRDVETGKAVRAHSGSVAWNAHRRRWVMIAVEAGGSSSFLGEVWYAEAETMLGPWAFARKVATHDRYSFYNPRQHPYFDKDGGRLVFFEGTYTRTFSGNPEATPLYEYNQVMYKLDLDDPRLNLPAMVYRTPGGYATSGRSDVARRGGHADFFALERPGAGAVALAESEGGRLHVVEPGGSGIRFYALPADLKDPPAGTATLREFRSPGASPSFRYSTDESIPGFERDGRPLCLVWRNPMRIDVPIDEAGPGDLPGRIGRATGRQSGPGPE